MKEITEIKELQKIELDILKFIDKVCKENRLVYFLAYGTLIGAIRHKGFIPWDDDVDIWMPRKDYKKFFEILKHKNVRYKGISCEHDKDYMYAFGKVIDTKTLLIEKHVTIKYEMGVYVDVFPYDGVKGSIGNNKFFLEKCMFLEKCRGASISPRDSIKHNVWWKNTFRIPFWYLLRIIKYQNIIKILNRCIKKYPVEGAKWVGCLCTSDIFQELISPAAFAKAVDMEFEGEIFRVPVGYDEILRKMYGNYMQLPPINKRVSHHNFKVWWIEEK